MMNKCLVTNMVSSLLSGAVLTSASFQAAEEVVVNISKVDGVPWFNRTGEGMARAGKAFGVNASQMGPSSTDAPQQVKIIEDLITRKVSAITIVSNDTSALEPVFKKTRDAGIVALTSESPGQPNANWGTEIINNEKFTAEYVEYMAKRVGGKGGCVVYVGSLTVSRHNLWADLLVECQKEHYPDMRRVTCRMPVAESMDDPRHTMLDLMKIYPSLRAVVPFGSNDPIGVGRAVREKRAKNKIAIYDMTIPSQTTSLIRGGDITERIIYDPASAGHAFAAAVSTLLKGGEIKFGLEIQNPGKADVDMDK